MADDNVHIKDKLRYVCQNCHCTIYLNTQGDWHIVFLCKIASDATILSWGYPVTFNNISNYLND